MPNSSLVSKQTRSVLAALFLLAQCAALCQSAPFTVTIANSASPRNSVMSRSFGSFVRVSDQRVDVSGSLVDLIMTAYQLKEYQIVGGRDWVERGQLQEYDIVIGTQVGGVPQVDQLPRMLQAVLADRFRLKFHRDTKELPAFDLVAGEGGPKFTVAAPCPANRGDLCARELIGMGPLGVMHYGNMSVSSLVTLLSGRLHCDVRDKTGAAGTFGYREMIFASSADAVSTALQEQLGLKLIPATESTEILVIDYAEKPSVN